MGRADGWLLLMNSLYKCALLTGCFNTLRFARIVFPKSGISNACERTVCTLIWAEGSPLLANQVGSRTKARADGIILGDLPG